MLFLVVVNAGIFDGKSNWTSTTSSPMITQEHVENNVAVRKMLIERGIVPENLPAAEDVKKVGRLASEEKKC